MMCGTQLIKTLLIQCAMAHDIVEDPGPILMVSPTDTDAKDFSRERLTPMARDCPALRGLLRDASTDGKNRLQAKSFPGGNLSLVGANAPGNLARRTIRTLFCDEIDKYKLNVKKEGDPVSLAWERTATFRSRKKRVMACSPTNEGESRIAKAYAESDQRKPWAPCRKCGQYQILRFFPDKERGGGVRFDTTLARERQAASAYYECMFCRERWNDVSRLWSCDRTEWRADKPFTGIAGFWISHLYSPWKTLAEIVEKFLASKDDRNQYQTFINTNLAELWKEGGTTPDHQLLYNRRESYPFGSAAILPRRALFLTASVDVQEEPPRLEVEVVGWGRGRENWSVCYTVIQCYSQLPTLHLDGSITYTQGEPLPVSDPSLWVELDKLLARDWSHESGHTLPILVMCIDTGKKPKPVYEYARRHPQLAYSPATGLHLTAVRTVVPIKGNDDAFRIISAVSKEDAARKRQGVRIVSLGTHCAKQEIYDALRHVQMLSSATANPGFYHFPLYDMPYFEGLCSETRVVDDKGKVEYKKLGGVQRNEPVDLKVYNRGGYALVGGDRFNESHWVEMERRLDPERLVMPTAVIPSSTAVLPVAAISVAGAGAEAPSPPQATSAPSPTQPQSPRQPQLQSPAQPSQPTRGIRGRF